MIAMQKLCKYAGGRDELALEHDQLSCRMRVTDRNSKNVAWYLERQKVKEQIAGQNIVQVMPSDCNRRVDSR